MKKEVSLPHPVFVVMQQQGGLWIGIYADAINSEINEKHILQED
jgi:hypothetical protein